MGWTPLLLQEGHRMDWLQEGRRMDWPLLREGHRMDWLLPEEEEELHMGLREAQHRMDWLQQQPEEHTRRNQQRAPQLLERPEPHQQNLGHTHSSLVVHHH